MSENRLSDGLLACPFCGAPPESCGAWPNGRELNDWWIIRCDNTEQCGAEMSRPTKADVIKQWNTRNPPMEIRHVE